MHVQCLWRERRPVIGVDHHRCLAIKCTWLSSEGTPILEGSSKFWPMILWDLIQIPDPTAVTGQPHGLDLLLQRFSHLPLVVSSRLNGCLDMEPAGKSPRISYQPVSHSSRTCTWKNGCNAPMAKLATFNGRYLSQHNPTQILNLNFPCGPSHSWGSCDLRPLTLLHQLLSWKGGSTTSQSLENWSKGFSSTTTTTTTNNHNQQQQNKTTILKNNNTTTPTTKWHNK